MAALEGAPVARATASGMAAVSAALLGGLNAGDHVVAAKAMFGSCRYVITDILPRFGITHTLVDGADLDQWQRAMRPTTRMLFLETPANPMLDIVDIEAVAAIADAGRARLIVDNAFASPALQRPMDFGAHIVVHSSTKYIDGQGRWPRRRRALSRGFPDREAATLFAQHRAGDEPVQRLVHLKSLETLDLRMREHCANALAVADFLAKQKKVARVLYPFRADHPGHDLGARADVRRRRRRDVRGRGWQGRPPPIVSPRRSIWSTSQTISAMRKA